MENFKGIIIGISESKPCTVCNKASYQLEKLHACELPFCTPKCQEIFWDEIYWDLEEEECETNGDIFKLMRR